MGITALTSRAVSRLSRLRNILVHTMSADDIRPQISVGIGLPPDRGPNSANMLDIESETFSLTLLQEACYLRDAGRQAEYTSQHEATLVRWQEAHDRAFAESNVRFTVSELDGMLAGN